MPVPAGPATMAAMVAQGGSESIDVAPVDDVDPVGSPRAPRRNVVVVIGICLGLLGLTWAWVFATPMGGFPDEIDHYLRSVGVANGEVLGAPNPALETWPVPTAKSCCGGYNPAAEYWVQAGLRSVLVPGDVRPELIDCAVAADRPRFPCGAAGPLESTRYDTLMGTIEPAGYLPSGAALALGDWGANSFRVARLATAWLAVLAIGLVLAGCASRPGFARRVVGLGLAATPMVVFVIASGSPNAIETGAAIAVWLAVLELTAAPPERAPRLLWAGFGVAGVLLVSARSLGPIWFGLIVAITLLLRGRRPVLDRLRVDRTPAIVTLALTALAALSTVVWEAVVQPSVEVDVSFAGSHLGNALGDLGRIIREVVGSFGSIDIPLPRAAVAAWLLLLLVAVVVGFVTGGGRARIALVALVVAVVGAYLVVDLLVMRQNGFVAQGRHLLAVVVGVPILAVEIVRVPDLRWRRMAGAAVAVVASACGVLQVHAWVYAATSWTPTPTGLVVGPSFDGTWSLPSPVPLIVVAVAAAAVYSASIAAAALTDRRATAEPDTS